MLNFIIYFISISLFIDVVYCHSGTTTLSYETSKPLFKVLPTYLSFNIDTGSLYNKFDFTDTVLINLVSNFNLYGKSQIRIGGGASDQAFYNGDDSIFANCSINGEARSICINNYYWDTINNFMQLTGMEFIYDLNLKDRVSETLWNYTRSQALIEYTASKNYQLAGWQLGNEVEDEYKHPPMLSALQVADDHFVLYKILSNYPSVSQKIYGPDACCELKLAIPGSFLTEFVNITKSVLSAVTVHHYPITRLANRSCAFDEYAVLSGFNNLKESLKSYLTYIRAADSTIPIILGETATTAEGGCDGLSNRFVAGFAFMYELGATAEMNIIQLNRQDIAGYSSISVPSNYALIGKPGWTSTGTSGFPTPHPDYFLAVLWKQLIGTQVLNSSYVSDTTNFDVHVWCSNPAYIGGVPVFTYINMNGIDMTINIPHDITRIEYFITSESQPNYSVSPPSSLYGDDSYLNGNLLTVDKNGNLMESPLVGNKEYGNSPLVVPPWSYGFVLLTGTPLDICN